MENSKRFPILVVAATILFIALFAFGDQVSTDNSSTLRSLQGIPDLKDPRTIEIKSATRTLAEGDASLAAPVEGGKVSPAVPADEEIETPATHAEGETPVVPVEEVKETPDAPVDEEKATPDAPAKEITPFERTTTTSLMPFNLPKSAEDWCAPPTL
eukprot:CAMPEP_0194210932 /NCGR_PEP_ID=MMETSP0156-20130528/9193_1 /TAXON_ID=33649 /ORGANISM="Thalassionema nitzschioides, Strain L26-B" /LENGTH=156 /DNA_ID=CAMNT_0038938349 /DNA_START=90 /DNA_END=557 /DNA_ORIENTATION=-